MTVNEFNKKYHLQDLNSKWFKHEAMKKEEDVQIVGKTSTVAKDIVKRFFKNKWNWLFLSIIFVIVILAIVIPHTSRYSDIAPINGSKVSDLSLVKPTWTHDQNQTFLVSLKDFADKTSTLPFDRKNIIGDPQIIKSIGEVKVVVKNTAIGDSFLLLGTDEIGRDVWTVLWSSTSWSLQLAILVATLESIIGVAIGVWIGFHVGKATDTIVMRIIEIFKSTPVLLWMLLFATILGTGFWSIALVLILVGWTGPVWSARLFTIKVKDQDFILAAEVTGVSKFGRIYKHILPNIAGKLLVSFVLRIPSVIFFEATLIFLGMTVGGEHAVTLGNMIQTGRSHIMEQAYYILGPVMVIMLLTISLQIVANGLRDAFDPKISG